MTCKATKKRQRRKRLKPTMSEATKTDHVGSDGKTTSKATKKTSKATKNNYRRFRRRHFFRLSKSLYFRRFLTSFFRFRRHFIHCLRGLFVAFDVVFHPFQSRFSSLSMSSFFVTFDVVDFPSSFSTSSFFRLFPCKSGYFFVAPCVQGCLAPAPVSCPGLPTSAPIFQLLPQIFFFCPTILKPAPILPRSMRCAPMRSCRDLPRFDDWEGNASKNQEIHL